MPDVVRRTKREVRILQVRTRERAEVRAAGAQDRVDVIDALDRADGLDEHLGLVPDPLGEGHLVHPPVDRA